MNIDLDKFYTDLPAEPYLASYELLQRLQRVLSANSTESDYAQACGLLEAYYELNNWKIPGRINAGGFSGADSADDIARKTRAYPRLQFEAYVVEIMGNYRMAAKTKARSALEATVAQAPGYAVLEPDEKKEVHKHISKIRAIIEDSGLDDKKKNSLFDRLAELAKEVDRNGTRTDQFFAFVSELGFSLSKFTRNARPAIDEAKSMMRIVAHARARHDGIKLPPGEDVQLLPKPDDLNA